MGVLASRLGSGKGVDLWAWKSKGRLWASLVLEKVGVLHVSCLLDPVIWNADAGLVHSWLDCVSHGTRLRHECQCRGPICVRTSCRSSERDACFVPSRAFARSRLSHDSYPHVSLYARHAIIRGNQ